MEWVRDVLTNANQKTGNVKNPILRPKTEFGQTIGTKFIIYS